jgi:hypothetical protein
MSWGSKVGTAVSVEADPGQDARPPPEEAASHRRVGAPVKVAPDLVPSRTDGPSHYNGQAAERARAVWPWGRNAKVRTGVTRSFS